MVQNLYIYKYSHEGSGRIEVICSELEVQDFCLQYKLKEVEILECRHVGAGFDEMHMAPILVAFANHGSGRQLLRHIVETAYNVGLNDGKTIK